MTDDGPDFELLDRATGPLIETFSHRGVDHVEYVPAFVEPFDFWVWLGTTSDSERDALLAYEQLEPEVLTVLKAVGLDDSALLRGVTVQSLETVDREHEGSWFYALR